MNLKQFEICPFLNMWATAYFVIKYENMIYTIEINRYNQILLLKYHNDFFKAELNEKGFWRCIQFIKGNQ